MKTKLVRIGNSRGIRIPKLLLEQARLEGELEMSVVDDALLVRRARNPRQGWAESFAEMARNGDDLLLDPGYIPTAFDEEEWEWPDDDSMSSL
jgi:antitoxin MazE